MRPEDEMAHIEKQRDNKTSALLVGTVDGEIICVASLRAPTKERLAHQVDLGISVRKAYWDMGAGSHMMGAVIAFARSNGVSEIIHLGVRADNVRAIHLYEKFGFIEIGRYPHYFKINNEYFDDVLMNLYL